MTKLELIIKILQEKTDLSYKYHRYLLEQGKETRAEKELERFNTLLTITVFVEKLSKNNIKELENILKIYEEELK